MKQSPRARATIIITCLMLSLSLCACFPFAESEETPEPPVETGTEDSIIWPEQAQHYTIGNSLFALRYEPDSSLNPIIGSNADNMLIAQLLYEGLFALDSAFTPQPVLCESIETADNLSYTVMIKPGIVMSDESELSASDVAYTLNMARERGRFVNRLAGVDSVVVSGGLSVTITLNAPNAHFAKLLDIPIIKSGSIDYRVPPGTGPYTYIGGNTQYLARLDGYRDSSKIQMQTVFLSECTEAQLIERFSDGLIDLLWDDPTDSAQFESSRQHDVRTYNTTVMQFVGFGTRSDALKISAIRRAIGLAIDREYITNDIMDGYALPSPLAFSPAYPQYDVSWEPASGNALFEISEIISLVGLADNNNDSYLEFPVPGFGFEPFSIDFIVNSENIFKTRTAEHIAETLRHFGFNIVVRELNWGEYTAALDVGDFDMFLGDVSLSADFDLSPLLLPDGRLNYGGTGDAFYQPYLSAYFTAGSDAAELIAAKELSGLIYENAPFIPICYKKHAMRSCRGIISGASPTQSSVFFGLTDWTIELGSYFS